MSNKPLTAAVAAAIGVLMAAAQAAPSVPIASPDQTAATAAAADYWTSERMHNAKPKDMGRAALLPSAADRIGRKASQAESDGLTPDMYGGRGLDFTSSRITPVTARKSAPYRQVGKLFFTIPGSGDYVCSASVFRQRLIVTAGHCVHSGSGTVAGYYTNFLFVPAWNGTSPGSYGNWTWGAALTSGAWYFGAGGVPNAEDWAIIQMNDDSQGRKIGARVGQFDYLTGRMLNNHLTMLGYPVAFSGGNTMHHCSSSDYADNGSNTAVYGCDMTGGASGGPWVQNFGVYASGQVAGFWGEPNRLVGVTSYGPVDTTQRYLGASIFNANFDGMVSTMCAFTAGNC